MITVKRQGSHYYFQVRPVEPVAGEVHYKGNPGGLSTTHELSFQNSAAAAAFLRHFAPDQYAVYQFQVLLSWLGLQQGLIEVPEQWIERLAPYLASGRVSVMELVPLAPANPDAQGRTNEATTTPPPKRKDPDPAPVEQQDPATFADVDEDAQVQTLVQAAQSGAPFCEACARAAAAAAARNNNQPNG